MGNRNSRWMALGLGVSVGGGGGEVIKPTFLLRDDFLTDEAAPLASPRAAEPGPGTLTIVDTESKLSIAGGAMVVAGGKAIREHGDPSVLGEPLDRVAGRTLLVKNDQTSTAFSVGFDNDPGGTLQGNTSIYFSSGKIRNYYTNVIGDIADGSTYFSAIALRSLGSGSFAIVKGGSYPDWTLLWVYNSGSDSVLYPGFANYSASIEIDTIRVTDLAGPWADDYGIATDRLAGSVGHWQPFAHEPDCLVEWAMAMVGGEDGYGDVYLRFTDESNALVVSVTLGGDIELYEVSKDNWSLLGSASGVVSSGHRIVTVCDGEDIRVYSSNALRVTAASSVNLTAAEGRPSMPQGEGPITDLIAWPRTLTGEAKAWLDAAIAD